MQCLDGGTKAAKVRKDLDEGARAGVAGTPAFFLGVADGATVKVIRVIKGAQGFASFKDILDGAFAGLPGAHHAHK
jgi:protein-disulfide isomerase